MLASIDDLRDYVQEILLEHNSCKIFLPSQALGIPFVIITQTQACQFDGECTKFLVLNHVPETYFCPILLVKPQWNYKCDPLHLFDVHFNEEGPNCLTLCTREPNIKTPSFKLIKAYTI